MEKWRRRLMRLMLPFGIAWIAYGLLFLVAGEQPGGPSPLRVFSGVFYIVGGVIFVLNWWVDRRETS
jgi:predicted membrane channel-forming protein YqfA (hemolysin III family)